MKHNIILDVDGTLWDTTDIVAKAWSDACRETGLTSTEVTSSKLKKLFGKTMDIIGKNLFYDVNPEEMKRLLDACCKKEEYYLEKTDEKLLYPDVFMTIDELHKKGKKLYIVSNCQKGYIELFMKKNNLTGFINDFECYGNTGEGKAYNIRLLMRRNDISADDVCYVGDIQSDKDACDEAGIDFIFASYGFGNVDDYVLKLKSFSDLLKF